MKHSSASNFTEIHLTPRSWTLTWEAASYAATREFLNILWNQEFHYRVNKSPPLVSILSSPPYLRSILILSFHIRLYLRSGILPSRFLTKIIYAFLFPHQCYMPRSPHPPWLGHSNHTWRRVQVMKLLIMLNIRLLLLLLFQHYWQQRTEKETLMQRLNSDPDLIATEMGLSPYHLVQNTRWLLSSPLFYSYPLNSFYCRG
jgi:hypothetical protein